MSALCGCHGRRPSLELAEEVNSTSGAYALTFAEHVTLYFNPLLNQVAACSLSRAKGHPLRAHK